MKNRARRLWLGDWQRDDPTYDSDSADTVLLSPVDEEEAPEAAVVERRSRGPWLAALVAVVAVFAVLLALSSPRDNNPVASQQQQQFQAPQTPAPVPQAPPGGAQGFAGPDLTGAGAIRAARAALAKYPGAVERVTAGPGGGGYVVHVIQGDGTEVHVLVDGGFHVQGSDAGSAPPTFGPGTSQ